MKKNNILLNESELLDYLTKAGIPIIDKDIPMVQIANKGQLRKIFKWGYAKCKEHTIAHGVLNRFDCPVCKREIMTMLQMDSISYVSYPEYECTNPINKRDGTFFCDLEVEGRCAECPSNYWQPKIKP